jgi:hypothetical protein
MRLVPASPRRALAYAWAAPTSAVGLVLSALALPGGHFRLVDGVLEVCGGWLPAVLRRATPLARGATAVALGHVVLARDAACLAGSRAHERAHVRQAERWGPFFLPAYLVAGAVQLLKGRDPYRDNPFEVEARADSGHDA